MTTFLTALGWFAIIGAFVYSVDLAIHWTIERTAKPPRVEHKCRCCGQKIDWEEK